MSDPADGPDRAHLATLGIAAFLSIGSMRICDPLLPAFGTAFAISTGTAARTVSAFAIAYGVMQLVYGYLGDRFGKLRVIACACSASVIGNLAAAAAQDFDLLVAARVLSGMTAAGIVPQTLAWIGDTTSYERRQPVLAKILTATVLGSSLGQWVSGFIADHFGWRWVFGVWSAGFAFLGVRLLMLAWSDGASRLPRTPGSYWRQVAAVFETPWARWILLVTALEGAFAFSATAFLPAHLHFTFLLAVQSAAAVIALFGLGGLLYSLQAKFLVARLGEVRMVVIGGACIGAGFVAMSLAPGWSWILPAVLFAGFGFNMLHNTLQTHATQMAPKVRGTAVSLFGACLFVGQSMGVWAASAAVDTIGFRPIFGTCSVVIVLLAALFAVSLVRRRRASIATGP